jgi:hypothetical protein
LAQAAAYAELGPDWVLRARPFQRYVVDTTHDGVVLTLGDRTLKLPAATDKAVRALAGGAVLRVVDLPGLDPEDALTLARRLVRESVVVVDGR